MVDLGLSDHRLIACDIDISPPKPVYDSVVSRSWCRFDVDSFRRELNASILCLNSSARKRVKAEILLDTYETTLKQLLAKNGPTTVTKRRVWKSDV